MDVSGVEIAVVDLLQLGDALERRLAEGRLAVEGVQHDALDEIAERDLVVLGERLHDLEQALLQANAGLHPLDDELLLL